MNTTSDGSGQQRALICGVTGQDGAYLSRLLLEKGYQVWGTSRDAETSRFAGLRSLAIHEQVRAVSMSAGDFRSVLQAIAEVRPHEIYNLAGQSSVGLSFQQPVETTESISVGVLNLLEAIRFLDPTIRLYNAGSSECFGDTGGVAADELTAFKPRSPYAVAKAAATWQVSVYRESYGLFACTGILFNHESPLRPERFVTRKIVAAACRIANGRDEKLRLGEIAIRRDWGWAPEYVQAMWRMLNRERAEDFVIGTGVTQSLEEFVSTVFSGVGLEWRDYVVIDRSLFRPSDIRESRANPAKARDLLAWVPQCLGPEVALRMLRAEQARFSSISSGE